MIVNLISWSHFTFVEIIRILVDLTIGLAISRAVLMKKKMLAFLNYFYSDDNESSKMLNS